MNSHLPVYTEVLGYNQNLAELRKRMKIEAGDDTSDDEEILFERGYESEGDDSVEDTMGIKGMTF